MVNAHFRPKEADVHAHFRPKEADVQDLAVRLLVVWYSTNNAVLVVIFMNIPYLERREFFTMAARSQGFRSVQGGNMSYVVPDRTVVPTWGHVDTVVGRVLVCVHQWVLRDIVC